MSRTVDSKVVEMRFDNKQFESNVSDTMSTLDKLKQRLSFKGVEKGFDNINAASKSVNMSFLGSAVDYVGVKFNAMWTIADQTLRNITNSVESTAKRMISALTIDPIKTGFSEYETKIGSIQTIMSNTASKGTTMEDVTRVIGELNTYADKTIYNFAEMTRNIGTFTAAGIELEPAAVAIQGIANLAAVSGSTSQQASTAMYQLSQAMASGTVKLMDWNSVVNAGMGGQVFQDALKATARAHGVAVDSIIDKAGSFRESLSQGWITSEILTETLSKMTKSGAAEYLATLTGVELDQINATQKLVAENKDGKASYDELAETLAATGKISKEEAISILTMADNAEDAATKVKTFTQLWDTLKESAQSGWSQTWELLIGDFEEAKEFLTSLSDLFGGIINESAERRNNLLGSALGDRALGVNPMALEKLGKLARETGKSLDEVLEERGYSTGREMLLQSLMNVIEGIGSVIKPVKEAFAEIFPAMTAERLKEIIRSFKTFTEGLALSEEHAAKVKDVFKGLFSIASMVGKVFKAVGSAVMSLVGSDGVGSFSEFILDTLVKIANFFTELNEGFDAGGLAGGLEVITEKISNLFGAIPEGLTSFGSLLSTVGGWIKKAALGIWNFIKPIFTWISENVTLGDVLKGLLGGGVFVLIKKLGKLVDGIKEKIEGLFGKKEGGGKLSDIIDGVTDVFGKLGESLQAFTAGIKVWSLVGIAVAVALLASSMRTISELSVPDIAKSLVAIAALLGMLALGFKSLSKSLKKFEPKGMIKSGIALVLLAAAVKILAGAMVELSDLSLPEIAKGLIAVGGGIALLCAGLKVIDRVKVPLSTSIALLALAVSCKILGDALQKFGTMAWDEIGRGLTAMGGALTELVIAVSVLGKTGGMSSLLGSVGILIAVQSLEELSDSLKKFGEMQWDEIGRGLAAMGGALLELGLVLGIMNKLSSNSVSGGLMGGIFGKSGMLGGGGGFSATFSGLSNIFSAGALWIVIQGLSDLADALKEFGEMQWDEIGRGVTSMGGALAEVGGVTAAVGKIAGFSSIFGAGSILMVIQGLDDLATALERFGTMSWGEIGRGLTAMGGALLEVGAITGALGYLTGFAGIMGAGTILIAIQGLDDLATALERFGAMEWGEIGRGLTAMGGALLEVGAITGALGFLTGFAGLVGAGTLLLTISGLDDLANALQKFGTMSWEEIGRGLSAMSDALGVIALGGFINTLSIIGSLSISAMAEPLGTLADSVRKWEGVTVPEGLGWQLTMLASGIMAFTLGGLGALTIAALAEPLGTLADSVTKWEGVTVPEDLSTQLEGLADGIGSFTWKGLAANSISELAAPLGTLADSVSKWSGVTIPEDLSTNLAGLAEGLSGFSWLFVAGWSLSAIVEPLASLADSVLKWKNVSIPDTLTEDLEMLADAMDKFSWAFLGGWSLGAITGPLGDLADAVKKWKNVSIPDGLSEDLENLAKGVKAFSGNINISPATNGLDSIATSATTLNGINFPAITLGLTSISRAIITLATIDASKFTALDTLSDSVKNLADTINKSASKITSGCAQIPNAILRVVSSIKGKYSSFYEAGGYIGTGLVKGINSKQSAVYNAGYALGQAAVRGEKDGQASRSPSKLTIQAGKWFGEGLVIGINNMGDKVYAAGSNLGGTAVDSLSSTISNISDVFNSDIDSQLTVRPVVDLGGIHSGATAINDILGGMGGSVGVLANVRAINATMNSRSQNGANDAVVSEIRKLRKGLDNVGNTTNIIDGVTYDDGSNVSDAVKVLVRAAKVERRR